MVRDAGMTPRWRDWWTWSKEKEAPSRHVKALGEAAGGVGLAGSGGIHWATCRMPDVGGQTTRRWRTSAQKCTQRRAAGDRKWQAVMAAAGDDRADEMRLQRAQPYRLNVGLGGAQGSVGRAEAPATSTRISPRSFPPPLPSLLLPPTFAPSQP